MHGPAPRLVFALSRAALLQDAQHILLADDEALLVGAVPPDPASLPKRIVSPIPTSIGIRCLLGPLIGHDTPPSIPRARFQVRTG